MQTPGTRRDFLKTSTAAAGGLMLPAPMLASRAASAAGADEIKVVVWDEQQPAQKQAYDNFLGNEIAAHLKQQPGLSVRSVRLDDPQQGLADDVLDACDVLIWWGHVRHDEITPETGRKLVARIKAGGLSLVALHSAHWSTPFMEAMSERTRLDVARIYRTADRTDIEVREVPPPQRHTLPRRIDRLTPYVGPRKFPDGSMKLDVHLPYCCFPAYREDGKPSTVTVRKPDHPIMKGVPAMFQIPHTEMYDEPFHVPEPDELLFEECWATGEWFRSGMLWKLGKGWILYIRPGHETHAVFKQPPVLRILANAARWLGSKPH
jgi:trehalose utilization protein